MNLTWEQALYRVHAALDELNAYEEPNEWPLICYVERLVKMERELEEIAGELEDDEKEVKATLAADSLVESRKEEPAND